MTKVIAFEDVFSYLLRIRWITVFDTNMDFDGYGHAAFEFRAAVPIGSILRSKRQLVDQNEVINGIKESRSLSAVN